MLEEALNILEEQAGITMKPSEAEQKLSQESVTAGRDELDSAIISSGLRLPLTIMTHMFLYVDDAGKDSIVYFITDVTSSHEYTRGLLVRGKLVWSSRSSDEE